MGKFLLPQFTLAQVLGIGLGFTFFYAGVSSLLNPELWVGYLPAWLTTLFPAESLILIHGVFHTALGVALATNFMLRAASLIAALDLAAIILSYGIDAVTFRDAGLLIMAAALYRIARGDLDGK